MSKRISDVTGAKFGRLVAVQRIGKTRNNVGLWLCKCECGAEHVTRIDVLKSGNAKSCGCLAAQLTRSRSYKHGEGGANPSPEYSAWSSAKNRCRSKSNKDFNSYGGRGIKFCSRWDDYSKFLEDVGRRPTPEHSLERIDNNGDYCPENCKWATKKEQQNNRRPWVWGESDRRVLPYEVEKILEGLV